MRLAYLLDGLHCSGCGTLDGLWLYPVRGVVECRECGEKASVFIDSLGGDW